MNLPILLETLHPEMCHSLDFSDGFLLNPEPENFTPQPHIPVPTNCITDVPDVSSLPPNLSYKELKEIRKIHFPKAPPGRGRKVFRSEEHTRARNAISARISRARKRESESKLAKENEILRERVARLLRNHEELCVENQILSKEVDWLLYVQEKAITLMDNTTRIYFTENFAEK